MAKRKFSLPGIHELSKEQEEARALPQKGQHLIIGGPGTGKSVVALLRARRHHEDKSDYVFLVYNRLLHHASFHLFGPELISITLHRWYSSKFPEMTGKSVPLMPSLPGNSWQDIDWVKVTEYVAGSEPSIRLQSLIIDEGQDMPKEFYVSLVNLGFENFYVVADQNQQIIPGSNSSRQDIENALDIATDEVVELRMNHRNSYPIARLAREFYTGDPATPPPELPSINRSANRPILVEYGVSIRYRYRFHKVIDAILKTADRDPSKLLGIIAPNNDVRVRYVNELKSHLAELKLDNGKPLIQTYKSGDEGQLAFDEGGIMVINAQSCKGLEFDTVFLADIDQHHCNHAQQEVKRRLFYVMVARARDHVIMLRNADNPCPVMDILPNDSDILDRIGVVEDE